jgi:hypothetical protein
MNCQKRYRIFDRSNYFGFKEFTCLSLRKHYGEISSDKDVNPKYVMHVRDCLLSCPECNASRIDMIKELNPKNADAYLKEYEIETD